MDGNRAYRAWRAFLSACVMIFSVGLIAISGCSSATKHPLTAVDSVDLSRYVGKWYEIARYPASFQEGCFSTTAEYAIRDDGKIEIVNRCNDKSFDGQVRMVKGVARAVDPASKARLKVSFFWPFEGDYWIIDLDSDYQWAVVGEPSRKYLWILSRTPNMDQFVYASIIATLPEKGYDPSPLLKTPQANAQITGTQD